MRVTGCFTGGFNNIFNFPQVLHDCGWMLKSHKERQGKVLSRTNKIHGQLSALRKKKKKSQSFAYFTFSLIVLFCLPRIIKLATRRFVDNFGNELMGLGLEFLWVFWWFNYISYNSYYIIILCNHNFVRFFQMRRAFVTQSTLFFFFPF